MSISPILKIITSNRAGYLANLDAAFELSGSAELDDDGKKRLERLMSDLNQDTVSPTLLLPEQKTTLDEVVKRYDALGDKKNGQVDLTVEGEYLVLHNISCTDANGKVFERYDTLYVRRDIERSDGKMQTFIPYLPIG